ncbi:MAG: inositol monophosphatase, partial [Polaromonas sp.]|nr:inositol monophosphatase [Polaromonas sp.]
KYSKFAGAGDKATVRQAALDTSAGDVPAPASEEAAAAAPEKTTLKSKRIKAGDHKPATTPNQSPPDAPF